MFFIFDDTKEPEDIFSETAPAPAKEGAPPAPGDAPTPAVAPAPEKGTTPLPVGGSGVIIEKSAFGKKFVIIGIVGALILVAAGWFFLFRNKGASVEVVGLDEITAPAEDDSLSSPPPPAGDSTGAAVGSSGETEGKLQEGVLPEGETLPGSAGSPESSPPPPGVEGTSSEPAASSPPPPAEGIVVVDTDGDGLSDEEEIQLGTDPFVVDTDGDGLSDREEVRTYNTDPNNPDTDGDTYKDGDEIQNGFDPNGPGRLLQIPQ